MDLKSALKPIRIVSQILGLNLQSFFGRIYTVTVFLIITFLNYPSFVHLNHGRTEIEISGIDSMILWTQFFANIIRASVSLIACLIKPQRYLIPINDIHRADLTLRYFGIKINEKYLHRKGFCRILLTFIISNLLGARDMYLTIKTRSLHRFLHWLHYGYVIFLSITIDFIFVSYINVLEKRFIEINRLLNLIDRKCKFQPSLIYVDEIIRAAGSHNSDVKKRSESVLMNVEKLRLLHHDLCFISKKINDAFGLQQLVSTTISLIMITGQFYEAFRFLVIDKNFIDTGLVKIMWTTFHVTRLLYVCYSCSRMSHEANSTAFIINQIPVDRSSNHFISQMKHFSLQLIHDKVTFNACGFFDIDYKLICSIVGFVTTYLVILIQMDRKANTPAE